MKNTKLLSLLLLIAAAWGCKKETNILPAVSSSDAVVRNSSLAESGSLSWYKHNGYLNGTTYWANNGIGKVVSLGFGWADYKSVFATDSGVIYGIQADGKLIWYRNKGYLDGAAIWANGGVGIPVGSGWANFKSVFATDGGVIYGIQADGKLIWYKHNSYLTGATNWANNGAGKEVSLAPGWAEFKSVFATDSGAIYGIRQNGNLEWYRHKGYLKGNSKWANSGLGIIVSLAPGWADFKSVFATSSGAIYGIRQNGNLEWYRHKGYLKGNSKWANSGLGITVSLAPGWADFKSVFAANYGIIYGINP